MPSNSNITLIEVQTLAMQLPTNDRWTLLKILIESLQPETEIIKYPSPDKIISQQLIIAEQKKAELEVDIKQFEQQYQMSSPEFYQRFHTGELGDDVDFVEWNSFYEMWNSIQKRIDLLRGNKIK